MSKFLQISSPLLLIVLLSLFLNQKPKALATETFSLYLPIVLNDLDNSTPTAVPFETPTAVPSETPTIVPSVTPMPEQILRFSWEFTLESSPLPQKFEGSLHLRAVLYRKNLKLDKISQFFGQKAMMNITLAII